MKITELELRRVRMELTEPYSIAYESVDHADILFLLLRTNTKEIGVGSAAPSYAVTGETIDALFNVLETRIKPLLVGRDPLRTAAVMAVVRKQLPGMPSARAAVDMALYDLLAKAAGMPLYRLLGAYRTRIRTSITIGIHDVAETMNRARLRVDEGFDCIKLKGGVSVETDVARVRAVRAAFGPKLRLRFDANQGYTVEEARHFLYELRGEGLELLEQPTRKDKPEELEHVSRDTAIPIMADESVLGLKDAFYVARNDLVDMINIKLMKTGGVMAALDINAVARSAGYPCMIGCMDESAVGVSAGLHFALSRPNIRYADLDGHLDLIGDPSSSALNVRGGFVYPSDSPGLGWTP